MPECYTCKQQITFDKNIRSASGKQIPLNPDNSKHSHDDAGNSTWKPNPNFTPQQTEQFNQYNRQEPSQQQRLQVVANKTAQLGNEPSRGGSYLDTKRIRVMLEEMSKEIQEVKMMLNEILNSRTILDTSRYEGKNDQIYEVMKPFLNTQGVVASELLKDQQQQQKRKDPLSINHGRIADLNEVKQQRTKIAEEPDFPIVDTLTDDDEDDAQEDDSNPKGVIDDL